MFISGFVLCVSLLLTSSVNSFGIGKPLKRRSTLVEMSDNFYSIKEMDSKGKMVDFSDFKGKVVYGVNVASKCGYTASGYQLLSEVAELEGVEVALFPCNQFGGQEPGSDSEIESFCALRGVKGARVFTKADVNGPNTRPTYKLVKEELKMPKVMWNFAGKFIVDKAGNIMPVKDEKSLVNVLKRLAAAK